MLFRAPKSKYKYLFGQSMFETIWIIFSFLVIFFVGMAIKHYVTNNYNLVTFIGTSLMSIGALVILKMTRKYYVPAIFGTVFGTAFCMYSIIFVFDHSAISDLLWVILVVLFTFYTLGSIWGVLVFFVNMSGVIWRYVGFTDEIEKITIGNVSGFNTIINVVVATLSITYLIHRITQASVVANRDFEKANLKLNHQYDIVRAKSNEKTVLLQEIHHRVKNNLQIISSLIRLQSYETEDKKAKTLFETSVHRIQAMALIHEKMYQGDDLSKINLEEYLRSLAADIFKSYQVKNEINFEVESELEIIGNRTIVPLALIFNELITNSLKHAFSNHDKGVVSLRIKLADSGFFTLDYKDNGKWQPTKNDSSFGLELINTFTEQLDGTVKRVSNENGTHYSFKLKNID